MEQKVGFREAEEFPKRQITKLKIKGTLPKFCEKRRREIITLSMKTKLKENKKKEEEEGGGRDFRNTSRESEGSVV